MRKMWAAIKHGLSRLGHGLMVAGYFSAPALGGALVDPEYGANVERYGEHQRAKREHRQEQASRLADSESTGSEVTSE